jgi:polysaccharide biosynthesis transport protein
MESRMLLARPADATTRGDLPKAESAGFFDLALGFARRQYRVIVASLLIAALASGTYLFVTPPTYTASATMLLDQSRGQVSKMSVLGDTPTDTGWIDSQVGMLSLQREKIGLAVAQKLTPPKAEPGGEPIERQRLIQQSAAQIGGGLEVRRIGFSYLVAINFSSLDPALAVAVANSAADEFVQAQIEAKFQAIRAATEWLQERYQTLGEQASAADRAVVEFKNRNNIITAGGKLVNDQELTEINNRVGELRAKTAEKEARLNQIQGVLKAYDKGDIDSTVTDALNNPIITRLRGQYLDLVNREADWSKRFGRGHLAVVNLRNQARDIVSSIHDELQRIAETYKSDYEVARKNQAELEKQQAAVLSRIPNEAQSQITLRSLESSAQSYRTYYDNFLQNYTQAVQQQTSPVSDTRVIARATSAPKASPSIFRVLALSLFGGIAVGVGAGILREARDRTFRTTGQVQIGLRTDCLALIPNVKKWKVQNESRRERPYSTSLSSHSGPLGFLYDAPLSRYAESIRAIKLAADLRGPLHSPKVIGFTSSVPKEGKSTVALSLVGLIAQVGSRVILVDCDLRNPTLSRLLAPHATDGILEVLSGRKSLKESILTDANTNIAFLPAVNTSLLANSSQILAGQQMKELFETLRESYDYIIADLSPLVPVVDVRATLGLFDCYVYVVEWGQTNIDIAQHALGETHGVHENLLGVVLNKVDFDVMSRYEVHRSSYYTNKYYAQYGYTE